MNRGAAGASSVLIQIGLVSWAIWRGLKRFTSPGGPCPGCPCDPVRTGRATLCACSFFPRGTMANLPPVSHTMSSMCNQAPCQPMFTTTSRQSLLQLQPGMRCSNLFIFREQKSGIASWSINMTNAFPRAAPGQARAARPPCTHEPGAIQGLVVLKRETKG